MNQLSKAIKTFRESQGWSKAELGRKLGNISGQLIGQYEKEDDPKTPGGDFFIKWKALFGSDLLSPETDVSNETEVKEPDLKVAIRELAESKNRDSRTIERLVYLLELKMGVATSSNHVELIDKEQEGANKIKRQQKQNNRT